MANWKVPPYVFDSLYRYYRHGIPTGDFLKAVIADKAWEAAARADPTNLLFLGDIILFNGQARRFADDFRATVDPPDWETFDMRWATWRMRYSQEATEITFASQGEEE